MQTTWKSTSRTSTTSEIQDKSRRIVAFIRHVFGKPEGVIPLHEPVFPGNEKKYLEECIDSTFVSSVGKFVDQFENKIAEYTGAKEAVVCVNGTSALHLALLLCGVKPNDEVITQPLTFIATANAICYCDAHPVFLDVDKETMGLSPDAFQAFLEKETIQKKDVCYNKQTNRRIKACVPTHTFGHPCRIEEIVAIGKEYNVDVVEDAAESIGSSYNNKHTGTFGKIGVLSFNGNKTITSGGGGALLFSDEASGQLARHMTTQAKVPHPWEFVHDYIGYNYRMPNINAALGLAQLESLSQFIQAKRGLALQYKVFFDSTGFDFFTEPENSKSNCWLNAIILPDRKIRDEFLQTTNKANVRTRPVWRLLNQLEMYTNCQADALTNAKWLEERVVSIPSSVRI